MNPTGTKLTLHRAVVDSPTGPLTLVASDRGLRAVLWLHTELPSPYVPAGATVIDGPDPGEAIDAAAAQLDEYFAGTRTEFDLPLDMVGTDFQVSAWNALCTIPFGETVSYGEQARRLGDLRKARAVGAANGRNPIPIIVPCHRVVGANGSLTGFGGGIETKAWLLDHERRVWAAQLGG
jgi:methylated-DNA-[protein]-cysteine S-methyltransferase